MNLSENFETAKNIAVEAAQAAARKAKENGHLPATASGVDKSACWARFRTQAPAARAKTARPAQRIPKGMNGSSPACPAPFPPGILRARNACPAAHISLQGAPS